MIRANKPFQVVKMIQIDPRGACGVVPAGLAFAAFLARYR